MDNAQGKKIYYGIVLDNAQLRQDAEQSKNVLKNIGTAAEASGERMDTAISKAAQNIKRQVGSLETAFKRAFDEAGTMKISDIKSSINAQITHLKQLELKYKEVSKTIQGLPFSPRKTTLETELKERKQEIEEEKAALDGLKAKYSEMTANTLVSFRTQMLNITNQMSAMRLAGEQNTEAYKDLEKQLGKLATVQREVQNIRTADSTGATQWTGIIQGLQGLMGAYSVGTGVIGMFTKDQEKLMAIQTKMQSVMAVLMGMQQIANTLHSTSTFRLRTLAKAAEIYNTATAKTSVLLQGLGMSAKVANIATKALYGTLTLGVSVAIGAAVSWYNKYKDAQEKAIEKAKELIEIEKSGRAQMIEARFEIDSVVRSLKEFSGTKEQEKTKIEELNRKYGESFGYYNTVAEWYDILLKKGEAYIKMLFLQAKVQSLINKATEADEAVNTLQSTPANEVKGAHGWWFRFFAKLGAAQAGLDMRDVDAEIDQSNEQIKAKLVKAAQEQRDAYLAEARKTTEEIGDIGKESSIGDFINPHLNKPGGDVETQKQLNDYNNIVLAARERLVSEEIELERNKIEDKAALIEFDRKQTVEAIEKTREDALRAWTGMGKDSRNFDGSVFQNLIDTVNLQAAFDMDNVLSERAKKEKEELDALLQQYRTYEQQRTEITRQFNEDRAAIEKSDASQSDKEAALSVLEKRRKEAIKAVNDEEIASMQKSADVLVNLFEDASDKSVSEILKITETAEQLMSYLANTQPADITPKFGFTAAQLRTLKDSPKDIEAISNGIKKLNSEAVQKNPFATLAKNLKDLFAAGASDDKTEKKLAKLGESAAASADMIGGLAGSLSDMFAAMGNNELAGAMDTVQGIMSAVSNIGEGFAKGGIVGGITSVVSGVASLFSMANAAAERHREALKAIQKDQIAQQREYNLLLLEQNLLYEKGTTIFGTDEYGKAMNAIEVYKQALAALNEALAGNDAQKGKAQRGNHFLAMFGIKDAQAALKQVYAGLADIEIVTGHKKTGLFGWGKGKDLYSSVLDVYDDLIDKEGVLNVERAKSILATRKMSEEDKNALQNMIDLYEKYEEAMQSVRDYLSGIFGELGNTMSDALVDAFKNGSDAAEAFSKSVSDMLENLAQQMIYSVTLAPIMEKAQEQMLEIMKNGDLSDAEKFSRYAGVLANITDEALAQQENANYLMKLYQDMAAEKGIDLFQPDAERQASQKSGVTASQESVNEGNGRLTNIQNHTFDIRAAVNAIAASKTQDLMKIEINTERLHTIDANVFGIREASNMLVANSARMLQHLAGIEDNTSRLHAMDDNISNMRNEMRTELSSVRHTVSDIALKGLKLKH